MIKNIIIAVLLSALAAGGYAANSTLSQLKTAEAAVSALQTTVSALRLKHKQDILKTKIKERGKRIVVALPVAGLVALGWFEKAEYDEWKQEHPQGTLQQYSSEMGASVKEVALEVIDNHCHEHEISCETLKEKINTLGQG